MNQKFQRDEEEKENEKEEEINLVKTYTWPITFSLTIFKKNRKFQVCLPVLSHFDLLSLLDKNKSRFELIMSIFISTLVSLLASLVFLQPNVYGFGCIDQSDQISYTSPHIHSNMSIFELILFCFILASSQYSLLKSAQPDRY